MGLLAEVWNWRARTREFLEEHEALERGDREAARRQIVHGIASLLLALAGLVVFVILVMLGPRRVPREVGHAGLLAVLVFGPAAVILIRRGVRAHRKQKPEGRA